MAQQSTKAAKPNMFKRLGRYFNDVRSEMRRVVWPDREDVISSSWIVVITLVVFIVLIGTFDWLSGILIGLISRIGG